MKLYIFGVLFWLGETWYFGWNDTPSCKAEAFCDVTAVGMFAIVILRLFTRDLAMSVVSEFYKEHDKRKGKELTK